MPYTIHRLKALTKKTGKLGVLAGHELKEFSMCGCGFI